MITFVVNLHPKMPSLALAEPLLYPLRKEGELEMVFPRSGDIAQRLDLAITEVRKRLSSDQRYKRFQMVFITHIDPDMRSPYQDSISARMLQIRKLFLDSPLLGNINPISNHLIVLDHVNAQEDRKFPSSARGVLLDAWRLDTQGFIEKTNAGEPNKFFAQEEQLNALDMIWRNKVSARIGEGVVVNQGFKGLPADLREQVRDTKEELRHLVERGLLHKACLEPGRYSYECYKGIPYVDEQILEDIKADFFTNFDRIIEDPQRYSAFLPSKALKASIARYVGMHSLENANTFNVIRLSWLNMSHKLQYRSHIKLAVLITLLSRSVSTILDLATGGSGNCHLSSMSLDEQRIAQKWEAYKVRLINKKRKLEGILRQPGAVALSTSDEEHCSINSSLPLTQSSSLEFPFIKRNADLQLWNDWNEGVTKSLEDYQIEARRKLKEGMLSIRRKGASQKPLELKPLELEHHLEDLDRAKNDLQTQLNHQFIIGERAIDWTSFKNEQEALLRPRLLGRPDKMALIYILGFSLLAVWIGSANRAFAGRTDGQVFAYYALTLVVAAIIVAISFYFARRKWMHDIEAVTMNVTNRAYEWRKNINDDFEGQKKYLSDLCRLNTVRQNHEQAEGANDELKQHAQLLGHHVQEVDKHIEQADQLLNVLSVKSSMQGPSALAESMGQDDRSTFDEYLPAYLNEVYSPVSLFPEPDDEDAENKRLMNAFPIEDPIGYLVSDLRLEPDALFGANIK